MNLLWAFNLSKATDPTTGKPIEYDLWDYENGLSGTPNPYKCNLLPRSSLHATIIEQNFLGNTEVLLRFESDLSEEEKSYVEKLRSAI